MTDGAGPELGDEGEGEGEDDGAPEAVHRVAVDAAQAGGRLDAVIAASVAELSRAAVQRLIDLGRVTVGGAVADKAGARVKAGDAIEVRVPAPAPLEAQPEDIPLAILYEDSEIIVIDKPAGLVVHPAAGHASGTLVNALLFHCRDLSGIGGVARPGIVHRLDKDTSGVMVATKTDRAHAALAAQFAAKSAGEAGGIHREYVAIAAPPPPAATGTLRTLYGRHPIHRMRFSSKVGSGKPAVTHWRVERALYRAHSPDPRARRGSRLAASRRSGLRAPAARSAGRGGRRGARPPGAARRRARPRAPGERRAHALRGAAARRPRARARRARRAVSSRVHKRS